MRILALTVGLSAIVLLVAGAGGAPELPVPRHDTLQDYQNVCSEENGFTSFSMQISCIKSLVNESTDKLVNKTDPDTQLYLLTADKLADDVRTKRTTVAAARVNLQRALIEFESKHRSEIAAIQAHCSEANGFTTFSVQISCIKSLVNESTDKFANNTDPDTQLYLLTADKLADDVRTKRTTVAAARVNLQRALIEVESKHRSEIAAIQAQAESDRRERMAANERAQEAQHAHELEEQNAAYQRQQTALMIQANQQRAAQQQAERAAILGGFAAGVAGAQQQQPQPVHCQTTSLGGVINTDCR